MLPDSRKYSNEDPSDTFSIVRVVVRPRRRPNSGAGENCSWPPCRQGPRRNGAYPGSHPASATGVARYRGCGSKREEIYGGRSGEVDSPASRAIPTGGPDASPGAQPDAQPDHLNATAGRGRGKGGAGSKVALQGTTGNAADTGAIHRRTLGRQQYDEDHRGRAAEVLQRQSRQIQGSESPGYLYRVQSHSRESCRRRQEASHRGRGPGKD